MIVRVRLFAAARQLAGVECLQVPLGVGATVSDLRKQISELHPELDTILPLAVFAVDDSYADESAKLSESQSIACIPPVSGG